MDSPWEIRCLFLYLSNTCVLGILRIYLTFYFSRGDRVSIRCKVPVANFFKGGKSLTSSALGEAGESVARGWF